MSVRGCPAVPPPRDLLGRKWVRSPRGTYAESWHTRTAGSMQTEQDNNLMKKRKSNATKYGVGSGLDIRT